jgi:hypothetical protein
VKKAPPKVKKPKPIKSRAGGLWTESRYWAFIRSTLRRAFIRWPANYHARAEARRPYCGTVRNQKWEYKCAICEGWFQMKQTQLDHIVPCGSLKSYEDIGGFCQRLFCEKDGLRVLCKPCHVKVTNEAI